MKKTIFIILMLVLFLGATCVPVCNAMINSAYKTTIEPTKYDLKPLGNIDIKEPTGFLQWYCYFAFIRGDISGHWIDENRMFTLYCIDVKVNSVLVAFFLGVIPYIFQKESYHFQNEIISFPYGNKFKGTLTDEKVSGVLYVFAPN